MSPATLSVVLLISKILSTPRMSAKASTGMLNVSMTAMITGRDPPGIPTMPIEVVSMSKMRAMCWEGDRSIPNICAKNMTVQTSKKAVPSMFTVTPMGTEKLHISGGTANFFSNVRMVTGIVAALEEVEKAVMKIGRALL